MIDKERRHDGNITPTDLSDNVINVDSDDTMTNMTKYVRDIHICKSINQNVTV